MNKSILLIHGAWLAPTSLGNLRSYYEARGYVVQSPAWPLMDRSVAELRANPHPQLGQLTLRNIVDHYAAILEGMSEMPILIGHSYGGLIVQMLLDRGYGAAGVSFAPAPAAGIVAGPRAFRSALPVFLAWRGWSRALTMTRSHFAWSMGNTLDARAQQRAYDEYVVPAPGRIYYQSVLGLGSAINWKRSDRAPLLLVSGDHDRTVEPSMVRQQYKRYLRSTALTQLETLAGRSHLLIAEPGWEEAAELVLSWLASLDPKVERGKSHVTAAA